MRLATARGDSAVEALDVGETLRVLPGGATTPVIWIGRRTIDCTRHPRPHQVWPVRIAAGAFGPHWPTRDLHLSPDRAVFAADVLIPVKYLINNVTIEQVRWDAVTYYHVELPRHSVLLAERLPVESYLATGEREDFANSAGPIMLYPDFASRVREAEGCASLIVTEPIPDAVRSKIMRHAGTTSQGNRVNAPGHSSPSRRRGSRKHADLPPL